MADKLMYWCSDMSLLAHMTKRSFLTCSEATCGIAQWTYGAWGACSSTCGGGTAKRTVQCTSSEHLLGKQGNACAKAPPGALERECNVQPCEVYTWNIGSWSDCSQSCGGKLIAAFLRYCLETSSVASQWLLLLR